MNKKILCGLGNCKESTYSGVIGENIATSIPNDSDRIVYRKKRAPIPAKLDIIE
jgi:hypothetical protein